MNPPEYCIRANNYSNSERNALFYKYWAQQLLGAEEDAQAAVNVVVELGCGSGFSTEIFNGYFKPAQYFGVDLSAAMLRIAQSNPACHRVEFLNEKAESTSLQSGIADRVVSSFAFHWFDAEAALREMYRLLRPGGRALLVIPTVSGARACASGNVLLRRVFLRTLRQRALVRTSSIGMSMDALSGPIDRSNLSLISCDEVEHVESFDGAEILWSTMDSRGSLKAIFGVDRTELDLPNEPMGPLDFSWRVLNLILEKDRAV
jgi:SAM-dependent methyltransferase